MTRIIEDLLELSRFEAERRRPIKGAPIDVAAMAALLRKDVLARAGASAAGRGAAIESAGRAARRRGA